MDLIVITLITLITSVFIPIIVSVVSNYIFDYFWKRPLFRIDSYSCGISSSVNKIHIELNIINQGMSPVRQYWIIWKNKIMKNGYFVNTGVRINPTIEINLFEGEKAEINNWDSHLITIVYEDNFPFTNYYKTLQIVRCIKAGNGEIQGPIDHNIGKRVHFWEKWFFDKDMALLNKFKGHANK